VNTARTLAASNIGACVCGPSKKGHAPKRFVACLPSMQATEQAAMRGMPAELARGKAALALYEDARRDAVSLWRLKWRLWKAGQEKFYKTSKQFKAIDRLCWSGPTCQIRSLADNSACRFADLHGDALFRRTVDGTELPAVTMWFYGTLPEPTQDREWNRIKRFSVDELLLLEDVHAKAQAFILSAGSLPLMDTERLRAEAKRWGSCFDKARELIVRCSPACQGFLWLLHEQKMPFCVAREIAAFWGEYA